MEEEVSVILVLLGFLFAFLAIPFLLICSIQTCVAYSRTRKWQKAKAKAQADSPLPESANLVASTDADSESELDPEDSGDEAVLQQREEERNDLTLTFRQKFRKEFGRAMKGDQKLVEREKKLNERKERRRLAKEVAREMVRMERRKQGKTTESDGDADQLSSGKGSEGYLPSYHSATSEGR